MIVIFSEAFMPSELQVSLTEPHFGIPALDYFLKVHKAKKLERILTTYDKCKSEAGKRLERTFTIKYDDGTDAQEIVRKLSSFPYFELVKLNRRYKKIYYGGVKRFVPGAPTKFNKQWNLDYYKDTVDLDMPEAWAIERGDTDIVIIIDDTGTMIDTCGPVDCAVTGKWEIHSDFNHYWISLEDSFSPGKLNRYDIKLTDSNGDGVNDNIIGCNYSPGYEGGSSYQLGFWRSMPTDLKLLDPESGWDCTGHDEHGVNVASIAAAQVEGSDIVGIANNCEVYWTRSDYAEAQSITHAAIYADVINMSWGFEEDPGSPFKDAIYFAANDSDCVLIAAVGNDSATTWIGYPAKYDSVLAVGAVDTSGNSLTHSIYSNYISGENAVDVVAPVDEGIWVDTHSSCGFPGPPCPCVISEDTKISLYGTSFAAPQAAGIAALIRSRFPALNEYQVRERIKRGAEYYWDQNEKPKYGAGKINAYRSLTEWDTIKVDTTWGTVEGMPDTLYISGDLIIDIGVTLTLFVFSLNATTSAQN